MPPDPRATDLSGSEERSVSPDRSSLLLIAVGALCLIPWKLVYPPLDRFHIELVVSAGNGRLVRICENLLDQSQRVRAFTLQLRKPPTRTTEAHTGMLKAIEEGDGEKAVAIQVANKKAWLAELTEIVERLQLRFV